MERYIVQDRERCEMAIGVGWLCSDGAKEEEQYIFIN